MKLLTLPFSLILMIFGRGMSFTLDNVTGTWQQVYSNYFVQSTTEIDWYCVTVDIEKTPDDTYTVSKQASLHGGVVTLSTPPKPLLVENDTTWWIGEKPFVNRYPNETDLIVLTGWDDLSLFVWSRNSTKEFLESDTNSLVLSDLQLWNYTGLYKKPVLMSCNRNT